MIDGAFTSSILKMSQNPPVQAQDIPVWSSDPVNCALVIASVILTLITIRDFFSIWPTLTDCLGRWKGNITMEHSIQLVRDRNIIAIVLSIPFCLVVDRYTLYPVDAITTLPAGLRAGAVIGAFYLYRLVRIIMGSIVLKPRFMDGETWKAIQHAFFNYFIILSILMVFSTGILSVMKVGEDAARMCMYVEMGVLYFFSIVRTGQILASRCSGFSTILYLCALEIVPAGIMALAAVIL